MTVSVSGAFNRFRRESVDLDPDETATARRSRDYLHQQLLKIADRDKAFPRLDTNSPAFVSSGSFARRTKIRPLDDIDTFAVMYCADLGYMRTWTGTYLLKPKSSASALAQLMNADGNISSTRVLNQFKMSLAAVPNYRVANIHRNGEALSLKLSSYLWVFDVVPAVTLLHPWTGVVDSYLMPDGKGNWMRSDPRRDSASATSANQRHNGLLLPLVRLVKYWNTHRLRQGLSSYYVETLCLRVFASRSPITELPAAVETFFRDAPSHVLGGCPDPKGFGPNLDRDLDYGAKQRVVSAMRDVATHARAARVHERAGAVDLAVESWAAAFGPRLLKSGR